MRAVLLLLALSACDFGHVGNPLTLPVRAVVQGAENAVYEGRRTQVSSYLAQNRAALLSGDAGAAKGLFDVAGTPEANHAKVLQEINDVADQPDWTERATVIVMVHS